tara:strand:- start:446 stop:838 length:393 start_codon:yes stop_codon:yes gene_type:complete
MSEYSLTNYLVAINYTKEKLLDSDDRDWERKYPPFIVNKGLSYFPETVLYANEMNRLHHATKHMQFSFLLNSIRSRKRFSKWLRASKLKDIDVIKQYYGYSNKKASEALNVLTKSQIDYIKERLSKGGKK